MSTFEREDFRWRETYFILFDSAVRPALQRVVKVLEDLSNNFEIVNQRAEDEGRFDSLTCMSPDDYAALDISYLQGEEVIEQSALLIEEMKRSAADPEERAKITRIAACDARFDVMHFQQVSGGEEDDLDERFDPSALLIVVEALTHLTDGVAVDPQSGAFL
jgi:hypothetical protein